MTKHVNREHLGKNNDGTDIVEGAEMEDYSDDEEYSPSYHPMSASRVKREIDEEEEEAMYDREEMEAELEGEPMHGYEKDEGSVEGDVMPQTPPSSSNRALTGNLLHQHNHPHFVGLGINMGHGHAQFNGGVAIPSFVEGSNGGLFVSPGVPYSEPFEHHERCPSSNSNHSAFSAPPIMQQQQQPEFYMGDGLVSFPMMNSVSCGDMNNGNMVMQGSMEQGGQVLAPSGLPESQQISPTSTMFHQSPTSSHTSASISSSAPQFVLQTSQNQHRIPQQQQQMFQHAYPQQSHMVSASGVPTMMINYAPSQQQHPYPHLAAAAGHLTYNYQHHHHHNQSPSHQQNIYSSRPQHYFPNQQQRQLFVPHPPQPANMEALYPTPPSSSQS